jgi:outer membrane protein
MISAGRSVKENVEDSVTPRKEHKMFKLDAQSSSRTFGTPVVMAALVLLAGLGVSSTAAAEDSSLKVGYVDLRKALTSVEEGKEARKRLKQDYQSKQEKLNQKQKEVKKLKKELQQQSAMLSKEAKRKKQKKLQKKMQELQRTYMTLQRDLSKKEASETKEIFKDMRAIVEEIADENGYDLVLEKKRSSVLYANDAMDLTDELIQRFEAQKDDSDE